MCWEFTICKTLCYVLTFIISFNSHHNLDNFYCHFSYSTDYEIKDLGGFKRK